MTHRVWIAVLWLLSVTGGVALAQPQERPLVPASFELSDAVSQAMAADWLSDDERRAMRLFHGAWTDADLTDARARAIVDLNAWRLDSAALRDESIPIEWRAEARLRAGDLDEVLRILDGVDSIHATRVRAEALEGLGRLDEADAAVDATVQKLQRDLIETADELTEGVRALVVRSRLRGQPARDFQTMLSLYARAHQELDRLHWPARLAEAELLAEKAQAAQAVEALHETLGQHPRCADAWYQLGRLAGRRFDFDGAGRAVAALRRLNPAHPLADLLEAEVRLVQDDPDGALESVSVVLARYPVMRPAMALLAASQAIAYDEAARDAVLAEYERLSPGSAEPYFVVGRHLSLNRQYGIAAEMLEEAIRRKPKWPDPRIELGLLELQSGRDDRALAALRAAAELDRFNMRAANSLFLLEELAEYQTVESEHFVVRFKPGVDRILAEEMLDPLERIHTLVSERFDFEPDQRTVIELMPDHPRFAVRITGVPAIHTVAACTGPVIAMEVPKEGPRTRHLGAFDWRRVLQHEYTHTITLAQTRNRIPHWLTEAAAVSMELAPRDYGTCRMLASALQAGALFTLDDIKWGFVRPRRPTDRSMAYAQGHWMLEYMNETYGASAVVRLLARYFDGERESEALPNTLGVSRDEFYRGFLAWAHVQVEAWGLAPEPPLLDLEDELRWADPEKAVIMAASSQARLDSIARAIVDQIGRPRVRGSEPFTGDMWPPLVRPPIAVPEETLAGWVEEYPDHPDILELYLRRTIQPREPVGADLLPHLEHYTRIRPVDPFAHRQLAFYWLRSDEPKRAIPHLEELDIREQKTPAFAVELAKLYRDQGEYDRAIAKMTRALQINPYDAPNRELAATIAIQGGDLETAHQHIRALTRIEPDRPQHQKRLEAIEARLRSES